MDVRLEALRLHLQRKVGPHVDGPELNKERYELFRDYTEQKADVYFKRQVDAYYARLAAAGLVDDGVDFGMPSDELRRKYIKRAANG